MEIRSSAAGAGHRGCGGGIAVGAGDAGARPVRDRGAAIEGPAGGSR